MEHLEYWIIILVLLIIIILQFIERKDLYNRIMAKDLQEYKTAGHKPRTIKNVIKKNLEEAKKNLHKG